MLVKYHNMFIVTAKVDRITNSHPGKREETEDGTPENPAGTCRSR